MSNTNNGDRNIGDWNSGDRNSWDYNGGNKNSGNKNSGDYNSGNKNSWNRNSGKWNSGDRNSWDRNSGNYNSGNYNCGYRNSGDYNGGDRNSGDRNGGSYNSGDRNDGDHNSVDLKSGDYNCWDLNTNEPTIRLFNQDSWKMRKDICYPDYFYFNFIPVELERIEDRTKTEGGYLKETQNEKDLKHRWRKSFDKAEVEDVRKTLDLPNFDYSIFEEISWISKEDLDKKLWNIKVEFNWEIFVSKEELIKHIKNM